MTPATVIQGNGPVVLGLPHTGTYLPEAAQASLNDRGRALTDTDWHINRLYEGLFPDVTTVTANFHRYVIDANRDPDGESLYPGQNTTTLIPTTDFDGHPIWSQEPTFEDVRARLRYFHAPYHAALEAELKRVHALHGIAILYDCHSIRSRIPYLFDGTLPDMNIGTNMGQTCALEIQRTVENICATSPFSTVTNGRFKGGWTTRHYGKPALGIHAIQMELAQSTYLTAEEPPWTFDPAQADHLRPVLGTILAQLATLAPKLGDRT